MERLNPKLKTYGDTASDQKASGRRANIVKLTVSFSRTSDEAASDKPVSL